MLDELSLLGCFEFVMNEPFIATGNKVLQITSSKSYVSGCSFLIMNSSLADNAHCVMIILIFISINTVPNIEGSQYVSVV